MAERRMFAKTIIDSDAFLDMPLSTQALYFHLSMRADDEGFINNPRKIQRMIGASNDDMNLLVAKRFIIPFDSGVVVIKHWKIHNYIRSDRFKETVYQEEKALLRVKENGAYSLDTNGIPVGIPNGYHLDTQDSIGKDRIGKDSIEIVDVDVEEEKPKKKTSLSSIIENYTSDADIQSSIHDFIEMRKTLKKPMTEKALQMMLTKLDGLASTKKDKIDIINQSVLNSWQSVYPLKTDTAYQKNQNAQIQEHDYSGVQRIDPRQQFKGGR